MAEIIDFEIAKRLHYLRTRCNIWVHPTVYTRGSRKGQPAWTVIVGRTYDEAMASFRRWGCADPWPTFEGALNHMLWHRKDTARAIEHFEAKLYQKVA